MAKPLCTDEQFIALWQETGGSLKAFQERFGFASTETVCNRRHRIEKTRGITLVSGNIRSVRNSASKRSSRRIAVRLTDGLILVGSDAHIWPGPLTTAQRGFIALAKRLQPEVIVINGDLFDGAKVSRHPAGIWEQESRPRVREEIEACQAFLEALREACPRARLIWVWGNHDQRMEYTLAALVPQYEGVPGFAMKDHFPEWQMCMAVFVNDDVVIKHRLANGIHAAYNNALRSGRSMITGHLHSLKVTPWTDYNGTRYGVDTGTLSDPDSQQFDYAEEAPTNHRAGFVALTFRGGRMMLPELAQVWDEDRIEFRGELLSV